MRQLKKLGLVMAACVCLSTSVMTVTECTEIVAEAHSGRTDSHGGHRDNKNKSGLGSYHYHCGGYPAHLHENGVCPYQSTGSSFGGEQTAPEETPKVDRDMMKNYSEVFDPSYYYSQYEDLQKNIGNDDLKLFEHFLSCGMKEGRVGCEGFDVNAYRKNNPDLEEVYGDDLPQYYSHYISHGCHEGRACR